MIAIEQDAGFTFVIEVRSEINTTDYIPGAFALFLKTFLDILSCIFEVGDFVLDHLNINIFG